MNMQSMTLVGVVLIAIAVLLPLGLANNVYAIDYVVMDENSCKDLPMQGTNEIWDGLTSTCSKTSNLPIGVGDTLTVPNGVTLEFTTSRTLNNQGTITNNGMIKFSLGGDINNHNAATFSNSGIIVLDSSTASTGRLTNQDDAIFINTVIGSIIIEGLDGPNNNRAQLRNQNNADFTNFGTITITGTGDNSAQLQNKNNADFTNSGRITIIGTNDDSGRLLNQNNVDFTNSGRIAITGVNENSGWVFNRQNAIFTNYGPITIVGTNHNSGQLRNENSASITNSGTITLTGANDDSGLVVNLSVLTNSGTLTTNYDFNNKKKNKSEITNSGIIQISLALDNTDGFIFNDCGEITFGSISGNPIEEESYCPYPTSHDVYEDPTIGKSHNGRQVVENGICIDIQCWTVTADYHQDFELVEMLSDSTHTISTTVFCQNGVHKCNYVAYGVSPYGTNINDSVWKIILQKDHLDNWTMKIIDPDWYLGEVTSTTQIVNDNRYLSASATIEFKKPTPGMILNVEVRDSGGGYRDFKFNDGVAIIDAYAYPQIEALYDPPLEIKPLCLNENPNKRYTCAFDKVREWTIKNAEAALEQIK